MRYAFALLLLLSTARVFAQEGGSYRDSVRRPLPPSILSELHRSQKARTLVYTDTIRASDLEKLHFNDSLQQNYADSGFSMIDTAVSLPHKEWLDSELVEIPELVRFGNRVHFNYPPAIMSETDLHPVLFDSTLVERMNPVTRENLPFFDQSPIPMPLRPMRPSESFVEGGAGNVEVPRVSAWLSQSLSERSGLSLLGDYRSIAASPSAIHSFAAIDATLDAELGADPSEVPNYAQDLSVRASFHDRSIANTNRSTADHSLSNFIASAAFTGDLSEAFHYDFALGERVTNNNDASGATESMPSVGVGTRFDLGSFRVLLNGTYANASMNADTGGTGAFFGVQNASISDQSFQALFGHRGALEWYAGAEYLGGSAMDGTSYSSLLPVIRIRVPLNARWEIGGSFEPQVQLASLARLTEIDPFYSPELAVGLKQTGSFPGPVDGRSVSMDKINLAAYMNYMLSPDDEFRFEARYIDRDRDPVFDVLTLDSANTFIVVPHETRRFSLTAAGNFLLFARDVITGSAEFTSATVAGEDHAMPFEPDFKFLAEYHFNSIWDDIHPTLAFRSISRPSRSLTFLNANVETRIDRHFALTVTLENILAGPSDFWSGYPEYPQSFWASVRYLF